MKHISKIIGLALIVTAVPASVYGEGITVTLDGAPLAFDVPPQIVEGRTLVPMRAIFEAMGASVEWDGETQTITAHNSDETVIVLKIGSNNMEKTSKYTGYENTELDVPPMIVGERTLVPARAVAESFGASVEWDSKTQTVTITSTGEPSSPAQTAEPSPEQPEIKYDASFEDKVAYMKNFRILAAKLNSDGNYDITYTLQTYLEGRGDVSVAFECLDGNGNVIDGWERLHRGTDYTWSDHTASVTISGKTEVIRLAL